MEWLVYIGITLVIAFTVVVLRIRQQAKKIHSASAPLVKYRYSRKQFIMTKAENDFYQALQHAIGTSYMIYPQAHLDVFLDHKTKGQNWSAALSGIQRKSVDFLICNHIYYNPLVAIELDDASHDRPDRKERDEKVSAICEAADMPLVRIEWRPSYEPNEVLRAIAPYLR